MFRLAAGSRAFLLLSCLLLLAKGASADSLSPKLEKKVRAATLEVVVELPKSDPLTYEKPLPLELLPFAVREATHFPIGTAFRLGPNEYVSAAHVIGGAVGSQLGAPKLRDQAGAIHEIDQILKYSSREDFAVFSLKLPPKATALDTGGEPEPSSTVFAVGNALGEGIIIRDGVYTSATPEQQDGQWNWLRFSAATSPGNSGGPLLDDNGRVIGVVVAKSPNENLNYALPIARVLADGGGSARLESRGPFRLPFAPETIVFSVNETIGLPLSFDKLAVAMLEIASKNFSRARAELLAAHADKFFPKGEGSVELLHTTLAAFQPRLIIRKDKKWEALEAEETETTDLGGGGWLTGGQIAETGVVQLRLPDGALLADLVADSRRFMDLFLLGSPITRQIGPESVRITSLGPARDDKIHVDLYGRKWLLRNWDLPFMDARLISAALPVPDGFVVLSRLAPSGLTSQATELVTMAADLAYLTYSGSLAEWRGFLAIPSVHPAAFANITLGLEIGKRFSYRSPRFEFIAGNDLLDIQDRSKLDLSFSYFADAGPVV